MPNRKPTPSERGKWREMDKQFAALRSAGYRITCLHATESPINIGKGKGPGGEEKFYTAEEVKQKVGFLSAKNANGYNVYITPIDPDKHYMLIDDLDIDRARDFWRWGYRPALLQYSSKESVQAVCIMPKADVSKHAGNALFKKLNARIGDPNIDGFEHAFRLAGFGNKKPKRQLESGKSPFVQVFHSQHCVDQKATEEAQAIDAETTEDERAAKAPSACDVPITSTGAGEADIAANRSWYRRKLDFWAEQVDRSKIDRQLAVRLRNQGYGEAASQEIIRAVSPDIGTRHPRTDAYLQGKTADLYASPAGPQKPEAPHQSPGRAAAPRPR